MSVGGAVVGLVLLRWSTEAATSPALLAGYFGAVPTAVAYAAYFGGAHPVLGALSALLEPLTATVLSVVFLHDRLSALAWGGAVLLVAALAVGYWRPEPRRLTALRVARHGRESRTAAGRR